MKVIGRQRFVALFGQDVIHPVTHESMNRYYIIINSFSSKIASDYVADYYGTLWFSLYSWKIWHVWKSGIYIGGALYETITI